MIGAEQVDLVVLSARGHGFGVHADMAYGSVTAYLMSHCATPMLIVRLPGPHALHQQEHAQDLRLPSLASA
jgi:nucleotide-binding universal stress UspA family protein